MQGERYLELLPQLRRYMIFGDRLVVLTDSHQALLFQAEPIGWLNTCDAAGMQSGSRAPTGNVRAVDPVAWVAR